MRRSRTQRGGFTLVELLIVIAIIVVLMAIALPVFTRARESARQTRCMANLHDIAMALRMYRMDEGAYPGPYDPVSGQWGLNALYPTYVTSRQTFLCPDDPVQSSAGYYALVGPGEDTARYLKDHNSSYTDWMTYEQLLTISFGMYKAQYWEQPVSFAQRYSSYNGFYNYLGYAGWSGTPGVQPTVFRNYKILNYQNVSQPMMMGENIASMYEWYRWDPKGWLNLDYYDSTKDCYPNFQCVDRRLRLHLPQQVYWYSYDPADLTKNSDRLVDDLGRPLWDPDDPNLNPYGMPSAVFPGMINRNAPDNTIVTRCPFHRPWTKVRLPRTGKGGKEEGGGGEGRGEIAYTQPVDTAKDFVLRLDGSVTMVPVLSGYNWATQSSVTH